MREDYSQRDFEEGLIGATFSNWNEAREYRFRLSVPDFTEKSCADSWAAFVRAESIEQYLTALSDKKLAAFVTNCGDTLLGSAASMLPWIVDNIKRGGMKRRMRQGLRDIFERDGDLLTEVSGLVERERNQQTGANEDDLPLRLLQAAMEDVTDNDLARRVYTGITAIDSILGGLRLGNVSILGAEPSTGKTTLALNIAMHALRRGKKVLFFSLEMSDVQLLQRMIAATGKIDYSTITNKQLSADGQSMFAAIANDLLKDDRLYIYDTLYYVEQMTERIINYKPDLVLVDFLQFCRTGWRTDSTADRIEYIVSEFKRVAKLPYCQCHIMLLSQPSRQSGQDKQSMFTLKGSSAIEQGGDVVMLLDRPGVRDMGQPQEKASIKISKNKFGRTGLVDLYFDGEHQRFRELRANDRFTRVPTAEETNDRPW